VRAIASEGSFKQASKKVCVCERERGGGGGGGGGGAGGSKKKKKRNRREKARKESPREIGWCDIDA
jgi:hypothetical protein